MTANSLVIMNSFVFIIPSWIDVILVFFFVFLMRILVYNEGHMVSYPEIVQFLWLLLQASGHALTLPILIQ